MHDCMYVCEVICGLMLPYTPTERITSTRHTPCSLQWHLYYLCLLLSSPSPPLPSSICPRIDTHHGGEDPGQKVLAQDYWDMVETASRHTAVEYANDLDVTRYGSGFPVSAMAVYEYMICECVLCLVCGGGVSCLSLRSARCSACIYV
jgi:hypothetical protein